MLFNIEVQYIIFVILLLCVDANVQNYRDVYTICRPCGVTLDTYSLLQRNFNNSLCIV